MPQMHWTQSQTDAISARGGAVLVSAAAGSGKTAVLTERVLKMISDAENPVPADRLLIVTFSSAAATEMKVRIEKGLAERAANEPDNMYLREQQLKLPSAVIGTIHAFCFTLIRQNFQLLGLPADLRIADERDARLIRRTTLDALVATWYEEGNPLFLQTVELFSAARNDDQLLRTIEKIYDFTRSHPFPDAWLQEKLALYDIKIPIAQSAWGKEALHYAADALEYALSSLRDALELIREDDKLSAAYLSAYLSDMAALEDIYANVKEAQWDDAVYALRKFAPARLRPLRGYEDDETKQRVATARKEIKDLIDRLSTRTFSATQQEFVGDIQDLFPKIQLVFEMTSTFAQHFDAAKRERQLLDFSDLEQYAVRLLLKSDDSAGAHPTDYALELREEYAAIMIDEYQDTNETQEMIFSCLAGVDNLFMVGDVKQSIYSFRQANPHIFMRKKQDYTYYDGKIYPAKIILGANFRSYPQICHDINTFFTACMCKTVGEIDYNADEMLIPMGAFSENPEAGVSLEIVDTQDVQKHTALCEAEYVSRRIAQMLSSGMTICEKGVPRAIRPGDIGILLRSPKGKAGLYLKALADAGVPAFSGTQSSFLHTLEISTLVSILKAINNPLDDISLVSALMSPIYAFTVGSIARIRLERKNAPIYMALLRAREHGDQECARFLDDLGDFRQASARYPVARTIRYIYEKTSFPALVSALDNAQSRQANLRLFIEYVKNFERAGYRTLSQFLRFLDNLEECEDDLAPANLQGERGDTVRIMSIHRSKGLEFPVVFLCDCAKRFNREDLRQNVMLHAQLGFACMRRDSQTMSQHTTVALEAARIATARELASEEMRILYVALTRARERLILTGICNNPRKKLSALLMRPAADTRLPIHARASAECFLDWLIMAAMNCVNGASLREYVGASVSWPLNKGGMRCVIVPAQTSGVVMQTSREDAVSYTAQPSDALLEQLECHLSASYTFQNATTIPTKMAVTELIQQEEEQNQANEDLRFSTKPQFITHERLTAAMRGDAFHKYMLFADHERAKENPADEITRLTAAAFLSIDEGTVLSIKEITAFYQSTLYTRVREASHVEREYRFMTQLGKAALVARLPLIADETVTVQGICDLLFFEGTQAVIVDYKTDRVKAPDTLITRYSRQLALYANMIEHVLEVPVKECIIYSTALSTQIAVSVHKEACDV